MLVGVCLGLYMPSQQTTPVLLIIAVGLLLIALTCFYVGGMFLNDAFDAKIDAEERPERPIPSGEVSRVAVFIAGTILLSAGIALVSVATAVTSVGQLQAVLLAVLLAAAIVLYNAWHKNNPLSPLVMAVCRVLVYLTCSATITRLDVSQTLMFVCVAMLCYLSGLTAIAKQENLTRLSNTWPMILLFAPVLLAFFITGRMDMWVLLAVMIFSAWLVFTVYQLAKGGAGVVGQSVGRMIAGISLLDMMIVAALLAISSGSAAEKWWVAVVLCVICLGCFALTRRWQQKIPGT